MSPVYWFKWIGCLVLAASLLGCGTFLPETPYSSNQTPEAKAFIGDTGTSGSMKMGALGEFTFAAQWAKTADGITTGTVKIQGTKTTENNFLVGALSFLGGWLMPKL